MTNSFNSENKTIKTGLILILLILIVFFGFFAYARADEDEQYVVSDKEDAIIATLLENGYSLAGACGILGNISVENPRFKPDLEANHGITYGLFQWNDVGERRTNLVKWCNNRLLHYDRADGQLAFAIHELEGGDPIAYKINDFLKDTDDPENAAIEFAVGFERCIGATGHADIDGIYTGSFYPNVYGQTYQALNKRAVNAVNYYEEYSGSALDPALAYKAKIIPTAGIIGEYEDKMLFDTEQVFIVKDEKITTLRIVLSAILCVIIGYLVGNVLGTAIIARAVKHKSIYKTGDKLPSAANVLKHIGVVPFLLSLIIDISKLYVALGIAYLCTGGILHREQILWVGLGVILGNDFPFWAKFKGGMGIVTTLTLIYAYMPIWGFDCLLVGILVILISKSFPQGAIFISIWAVPYAFFVRGFWPGIAISLVMITMLVRHYKTLVAFFGKTVIKEYYNLKRLRRKARFSRIFKGAN